jgi:predicted TPR repeat methyltransferase
MVKNTHEGLLGAAYEAKGTEQVAALYDRWAETYDDEMAKAGYRHPSICLALLARYLPRGASPVLDAGAGTGLIGDWLAIVGYPHVEALDVSPGMLAVAKRKGSYKALHNLALGSPLPFSDGHFAAVVSAGVFTTGHVGKEGLDELVRITRSGGILVLTVKTSLWDDEFAAMIVTLSNAGLVRVAERTAPYVSMPDEAGTIPSLGLVLTRV